MTSPTLTFVEAAYVPGPGGPGKAAEPNPFTDVIAEIAMKKDDKTGKPMARAFTFEHPSVVDKDGKPSEQGVKGTNAMIDKYRRQLSLAGAANTPQVTCKISVKGVTNPVNGKVSATKSTLTFWTIARQTRPKAKKGEEKVVAG